MRSGRGRCARCERCGRRRGSGAPAAPSRGSRSRRAPTTGRARARLRAAGLIPGVVYGGEAARPRRLVAVCEKALGRELRARRAAVENTVYELNIQGEAGTELVVPRQVQLRAATSDVLSANFLRFSPDLVLRVPLRFVDAGLLAAALAARLQIVAAGGDALGDAVRRRRVRPGGYRRVTRGRRQGAEIPRDRRRAAAGRAPRDARARRARARRVGV